MRKQPYSYDQDFNLWTQEQASALKARQFTRLDYDNLIEEIEDMGKSEKLLCESYLERLIEHILKLQYWRATPRIFNAPGNARALESEKKQNYKHWQIEFHIPNSEPIPLKKILEPDFFGE